MSKEVGFNPYDTVMKTPHGKVLNWMGFFPDIEAQTTKGTSSSGTYSSYFSNTGFSLG